MLSLQAAVVEVPLEQIRSVRVVRDALAHLRGTRKPGAGFPGELAIGSWRGTTDGRAFHDFVFVDRPGPGVVITTDGPYDRVVLGTDEPEKLAFALDGVDY